MGSVSQLRGSAPAFQTNPRAQHNPTVQNLQSSWNADHGTLNTAPKSDSKYIIVIIIVIVLVILCIYVISHNTAIAHLFKVFSTLPCYAAGCL